MSDEKLKLWFFRDISSDQRLALFRLFDLPVDEIGEVHGHQRTCFNRILRDLRATPADAEPFAWAWKPDWEGWGQDDWQIQRVEPTEPMPLLKRPLYAHPPTDRRDALEEAARVAERAYEARAFEAAHDADRAYLGAREEARDIAAAIRALIPQPAPAAERVKMLEDYVRDASDVLGDLLCDQEVGEPDIDEDPLVDLLRRARALLKGGEHG